MAKFLTPSGTFTDFADDPIKTSSISFDIDSDLAYAKGSVVEYNGRFYKANADIVLSETATGKIVEGTSDSEWTITGAKSGIATFDPTEKWEKDDLVFHENYIYAANTDKVGDGSVAFKQASSGDNTWRTVATSPGHVLETDQVNMMSGNKILAASEVYEVLRLTLPSAGLFEVDFSLRPHHDNIEWFRIWIGDEAQNNLDPDQHTWLSLHGSVATDLQGSVTGSSFIEVTEPTTIVLWVLGGGAGGRIYADENGGHQLKYKKLAGFLPTIGQQSEHMVATPIVDVLPQRDTYYTNWSTSTSGFLGAQTNLEFDGTYVTLKAGRTYRLQAAMQTAGYGTDTSGAFDYQFRDTNGVKYGNATSAIAIDSTVQYSNQPVAMAIITPTEDIQVGVYFTFSSNNITPAITVMARSGFGFFDVECISGTMPIYRDYAAEFGEKVLNSTQLAPFQDLASGTHTEIFSFTLPSAGVWEIIYNIRSRVAGDNQYGIAYITDANDVQHGQGILTGYISASGAGDLQVVATNTIRITTTGPQEFKYKIYTVAGPLDVLDANTSVNWKKISGHLPITNSETLDGLYDVDVSSPSTGDLLKFDGSKWVPTAKHTSGEVVKVATHVNMAGVSISSAIYLSNILTLNDNGYAEVSYTPTYPGSCVVRASITGDFYINGYGIDEGTFSLTADGTVIASRIYDRDDVNSGDGQALLRKSVGWGPVEGCVVNPTGPVTFRWAYDKTVGDDSIQIKYPIIRVEEIKG